MVKYRENVTLQRDGSGYPCCDGQSGYCLQHLDFLRYELGHPWLGRSKVHPDDFS